MRKVLIAAAIGLVSLGASTQLTLAKPSCGNQWLACNQNAAKTSDPNKAGRRCDSNLRQCMGDGSWANLPSGTYDNGSGSSGSGGTSGPNGGNKGKTGDNSGKKGGGKSGKKVAKDYDPNANWNGKYTMIVLRDGAGTATYTFKQGVNPNDLAALKGEQDDKGWGRSVLGPDGRRYAPWDPKLGEVLVAAGVVDSKGNPITNANDVTAKEMYAKAKEKREQEARQKYLDSVTHTSTSGYKTPIHPPVESDSGSANDSAHPGTNTGTAGSTHPSSGPVVNDHRHPEPPRASAPPARPPVVLTGTEIRDHRKKTPATPVASTPPASAANHPPVAAGGNAGTSPNGKKYQAK